MFAAMGGHASGEAPVQLDPAIWDELADRIYHTAILHGWTRDFVNELIASLRATSLTTQHRWLEVLRSRMGKIRGLSTCTDCQCDIQLSLALNEDDARECNTCSAEIAGPIKILAHPALRVARAAQTAGLPSQHNCAQAMLVSFDLLCRVAKQTVIIDRFAVTDAIRQDNKAPLSAGLQKFLIMADDDGISEAHIYAAEGGKVAQTRYHAADLASGLASIISGLSLKALVVHLHVVSETVGKREIHDRWVGFSWPPGGLVSVNLGKGMSQFDGVTAGQHFGMSRQDDPIVSQLATRLLPQQILVARIN